MYICITYLPMYITVWTNLGIQAHFGRSIRRRSSLLVRRIVDRLARNFTYVHTEDMWHSPHWETQLSTCNQMRMLALPASQRILHISWWPSLDFRQLRVSPVSWKKFEFWLHLFVCFLVQQPHWETQLSTCNQMRMLALPASQRILHISWWPSLDFRQLRVSPVSWKKFEFWLHLFVCFLVQQPHWDSTFHLQSNALHYYLPTQF